MSKPPGPNDLHAPSNHLGVGRDYLLFWLGQTVSTLGEQLGGMALALLILERTGSAVAMSVSVILSMIPAFVVGPVAGVALDRMNRKRVLIGADVMRGVLTLGLGIYIYVGRFTLVHAYAWGVLVALFRVFYEPGTMAFVPALVPHENLQRANSLQVTGRNIAMVVGPTLAGLVVTHLGVWVALAANAATFGIAAACISFVGPRYEEQRPAKRGRATLEEAREGFLFFRQVPLAFTLLATTILVNACSQPTGIALNVHVLKTLGGQPTLLGLTGSVSAGAALLSSLVMATKKDRRHFGKTLALGVAGTGLAYFSIALVPRLGFIPFAFALSGFAGPVLQVPIQTLYQDITPPDLRGRVFALRMSISQVLSPLSFLLSGMLLDSIGSKAVFGILGLILLVTSVGVGTSRPLRDIR